VVKYHGGERCGNAGDVLRATRYEEACQQPRGYSSSTLNSGTCLYDAFVHGGATRGSRQCRSSSASASLGKELRYQGPRQNDPARPKGTEALTSSPCLQAGQSYLIVTRTVSGPREATLTRQQPLLSSPVSGRSARRGRVRVLESRDIRRKPRFDAQRSVLQQDARSATSRTRRAYPGAA
jgi:hypothetical protein